MHARIMLLSGSDQAAASCEYAEQLLTDISAAFDHSFSLLRGKIEEDVSEKVIEGCESSQGVLLSSADAPGAQALYDALGMPLRIRSLCIPEALCGRGERPARLWVGTVLSLDDETLRGAVQSAFRFAREEDARVLHVQPTGATKADWDAALRVQAAACPQLTVDRIGAPDAAARLILHPGRMGLLLCPPYAGSILESAATAACPHPEILYDFAVEEELGIFAPCDAGAQDQPPLPFAMALAVSRMLRASLHLPREAACLEAAIQNVMANGAPDEADGADPAWQILERISDQIAVAGELMGKGGLMP